MPYYSRDPKRDHHFDNHPRTGCPPTLGGVLDGFSNGEGENPLPFSLPKGGGGGVGGVSRARFPPRPPHLRQPFQLTPTPSPAPYQETFQNDEKRPSLGAKLLRARAPSPRWPGPQAPGRPSPSPGAPSLGPAFESTLRDSMRTFQNDEKLVASVRV